MRWKGPTPGFHAQAAQLTEARRAEPWLGDRAGRWHIAFAVIPDPIPAPGTGEVVGVDRGVTVAVVLSTGEMTSPAGLSLKEAGLSLKEAEGKAREVDRRKDWVEKVKAAYTSQTCNSCKHVASESRKNQATFACVACGHQANADVNAARNIAAGQAVTARGDVRVLARSVKREPQHARPPKVA